MKEQKNKTKPNPTKRTGWGGGKGFVLYFNCKIANPRIMFTFMFSVVQSLGHFIQTSAFSSLAASLTEGRARSCSMPGAELPRKGFPAWGGISLGTEGESLLNLSCDCLTLFLWSKVEMGNGFISNLCLTCCPLVVSIMSHPFWMLSSWNAGESTFPEKRNKLLVTIQITMNSVGINEHLVCTFCNIEYWFDLVKTRWILG